MCKGIYLSLLLLALFANGKSAHTLFHWVVGHEDTVHTHRHCQDELSFEEQHHHCNYHDFLFSPFVAWDIWQADNFCSKTYEVYYTFNTTCYQQAAIAINARGPPVDFFI